MSYRILENGQYEVFDKYISGYGDSLEEALFGYYLTDSRRKYLDYKLNRL